MQRRPETVLSRKGTAIKSHLKWSWFFRKPAQCSPDSLVASLPDNCQQVVAVVAPHFKPGLAFLALPQVFAIATTQVKQDASILSWKPLKEWRHSISNVQGKPEWWKGSEWHEARACVSFPRSVLRSPRTPARQTHKKDFCSERRIHLVDQFGLKLCSFLCKLVQKVRACFWRRGNPKIYVYKMIKWMNISIWRQDRYSWIDFLFCAILIPLSVVKNHKRIERYHANVCSGILI